MDLGSGTLATVVVPAFNEGPQLARNLDRLLTFLAEAGGSFEYEVIVVDDGSSDDTFAIAQSVAHTHSCLSVLRHYTNCGLGAAIRTGLKAARGPVAVTYDSDMSYDPQIIPQLLSEHVRTGADLVLASPYMRGGSIKNVPWIRKMLSREANRFLSFATNGRIATLTCMVRAYRVAFFQGVVTSENRMEINVELLFKALKKGAVVSEIPAKLEWSRQRAKLRSGINVRRTFAQIVRTLNYGIAHRPAVLMAIPGIAPGVLPLIVASCLLLHLGLKTTTIITVVTVVIQNTSLALFAGQLAVFGRNVTRRRRERGPETSLPTQ